MPKGNGRRRIDRVLIWAREQHPAKRLSFVAIALAFFDTVIHPISLTALGLLVLAGLPWLIALIKSNEWPLKSMKLPGGVEFEFNDLKQISEKAVSAGLLKPAKQQYSFEAIFEQDPNLAMAGLRIELERQLRELSKIAGVHDSRTGIIRLVRALEGAGALDRREVSVIADLVPMLNNAVHANELDARAFDWAMDVGPQLLAGLEAKITAARAGVTTG